MRHFEFCWQCGREWVGLAANDTCGRLGCENEELRALRECHLIELREVKGLGEIPSIRACPTCGLLKSFFLKCLMIFTKNFCYF